MSLLTISLLSLKQLPNVCTSGIFGYILVAARQQSRHCFTVSIKILYVLLKHHKLNTIIQSTSQNAIFQEGNKQHQP